ncbi:MAG: response regulator transcription factor [Candidatus Thiodiazotropha sp.]|jgi:two-component system, OmpR family, response regulator
MSKNILAVDDDPHILEVIQFALEKAGMGVITASDGMQALQQLALHPIDLIVLDINMPEMDGLTCCREIRKTSDTPILFLSSRDDEIDRILGLEIGGDDYVTKPFSPRELVARISAILKRMQSASPAPVQEKSQLQHHKLKLDSLQHMVWWDEAPVALTATEFAILALFLAHPHQVFERDQIMHRAYAGQVYVSHRTIDSHIRHIRQKFTEAGAPTLIATVHGVGYKLSDCR